MNTYTLPLADDVLEQARRAAEEEGVSVDQFLAGLVSEGLGHRRGLSAMRRRAARGDVSAVLSVLDKAPDVAPEKGDEIFTGASR